MNEEGYARKKKINKIKSATPSDSFLFFLAVALELVLKMRCMLKLN